MVVKVKRRVLHTFEKSSAYNIPNIWYSLKIYVILACVRWGHWKKSNNKNLLLSMKTKALAAFKLGTCRSEDWCLIAYIYTHCTTENRQPNLAIYIVSQWSN